MRTCANCSALLVAALLAISCSGDAKAPASATGATETAAENAESGAATPEAEANRFDPGVLVGQGIEKEVAIQMCRAAETQHQLFEKLRRDPKKQGTPQFRAMTFVFAAWPELDELVQTGSAVVEVLPYPEGVRGNGSVTYGCNDDRTALLLTVNALLWKVQVQFLSGGSAAAELEAVLHPPESDDGK